MIKHLSLAVPLVLGLSVSDCGTPVTPALVIGGITLGAETVICAAQTVGADTATNPPAAPLQIALDLAKNCGMDVAQIVALFGATHPVALAATQNAGAVHAAAMARKAATSSAAPAVPASSSEAEAQWQQAKALLRDKYGWTD